MDLYFSDVKFEVKRTSNKELRSEDSLSSQIDDEDIEVASHDSFQQKYENRNAKYMQSLN